MSFAGSDLEEKLTGEDISGRELSLMQKEKNYHHPRLQSHINVYRKGILGILPIKR